MPFGNRPLLPGWEGAGPYRTRLHHFLQRQVHPRIAHDQVAVQVLAVLELHQDGVALRRVEESEG